MAEVVDFIDKVKRYYKFTPSELKGFVISVLILAFIASFREWGTEEFDVFAGLVNFGVAALIVGVSLLVHISGQKFWSLATGYRLEFKMWGLGLVFAIILAFITNGRFWLLVPGGFIVHHLAGHRLGWFRYDINYWAIALIALAGPLATLFFVIFLKVLGVFIPSAILQKFIIFNIVYVVYSMLPIPPLDGSKIFYGGRMLYAFSLPGVITAALLLYADVPIFLSVIGSFLVGIVLWLLYYILLEKDLWFPGR
jgi:Zn-dependent protease